MLRKDCNVNKASNISSLHRETQSVNTECNRVKILHVIDYQDMYLNKRKIQFEFLYNAILDLHIISLIAAILFSH